MKTTVKITLTLCCMLLLISACLPQDAIPTSTEETVSAESASLTAAANMDMLATQVAQTLDQQVTQNAAYIAAEVQRQLSTALAAELTLQAVLQPTLTPTPQPGENTPIPTAIIRAETPTPTNLPIPEPSLDYHAEFVDDVTIPDDTVLVAGERFTKIWRLRNVGRQTWTTEFAFVFINQDRMEGQAILLPREVASGGTIDISIDMIAPSGVGTYIGYWGVQQADGSVFGIGETASEFIYVKIQVILPTPTATSASASP